MGTMINTTFCLSVEILEVEKHVAVQVQIGLGFEKSLEEKNYQVIVTPFGNL